MKTILLLCISQIVLCNNIYAQSSWKRLADFPSSRYYATSFSIGNYGYAGTGLWGSLKNDLWEFNPDSNTWTQMASLPAKGRKGAIAFTINQKAYLGSGLTDSVFVNDFWEYDPAANKWTQKADIPISNIGYEGTIVAFSVGGKGYVKTIDINQNFIEYDPATNTWTPKANFPGTGFAGQVGLSIGTKGYIGTGFVSYDNTSEFWEYDPAKDKWTQKADFPGVPRNGGVGFTIGNYGYIGLGDSNGNFPRDFWRYDPSNDSWTEVDSCGYGAFGAFAFSIGNKGYVGTGVFTNVGEFWGYDSGITSVHNSDEQTINNFKLYQNYPNPFNPTTAISFSVPKSSFVSIKVFDTLGRQVAELVKEEKSAGTYNVTFNAGNLVSGVYIYQLKSGNFVANKKLILMK